MFVSFLMPHVDRGAGPLFHLIMLLQMSRFAPDEICFIGDDAYFAEEHVPFGEELALGTIRFTCVSQERFQAYRKASLPFAAVAALYEDERSHLDAFQALLTVDHPPLGDATAAALKELAVEPVTIEAFLAWSNCPSLSVLAGRLGKPVIHNELGPLRGPAYQDTVYFDFQGVNGNTTPATAWGERAALAAQFEGATLLPAAGLRRLLYLGEPPAAAGEGDMPRYPLGVALQVEDDSNTLAYGRGNDAIRLLYKAQRDLPPAHVLVRSHPGARLGYRGGLGEVDDSPSSLAFLHRIAHLLTINSSVAAEAALWEVPYTVLGDTPFSVLSTPLNAAALNLGTAVLAASGEAGADAVTPDLPSDELPAPPAADAAQALMLNALLLAYLVPSTLLFDPDYYRWRLAGASLRDCHARHLEVHKRHAVHAQEALPALSPAPADVQATAIKDGPQRNPALWTATRSLTRNAAVALEAELAVAIAERDKNWDERCWFQTNLERVEQEIEILRGERDTLRVALAEQQAQAQWFMRSLDDAHRQTASAQTSVALALQAQLATAEAFAAESRILQGRYDEMERTLEAMHSRFDTLSEELLRAQGRHATAEAQSNSLLEELNRTLLERIDALAREEVSRRATT